MLSIRRFIVAGASTTCNDVGLYGILLADEAGSSWRVSANIAQIKEMGLGVEDVIAVGCVNGVPRFEDKGLQFLEKGEDVPPDVLKTLWG